MMAFVLFIIFWTSVGVVLYSYFAYPLLIWVFAKAFGRTSRPPEPADWPVVSIVIAALNEESVIRERVENALASDYPEHLLKVVIASDGSTDRTTAIVQEMARRFPERVRLLDYPVRRGKASVLNASIPATRGDIVVLSDANTYFERLAVRNLARWFADPRVGVVCGKLVLFDPASGMNVDSAYWRYETFLKQCEARLGALLGSNGAIYAIRREEYIPIPADTIIDDFTIPLLIKLRFNKHIVYDEQAVATEETPTNVGDEFRRRSRIGAGGFQSLARLWRLLLPTRGWTSFAFVSHKLLRWICPACLALALVANGLLAIVQPGYIWLFVAQLGLYLGALAGAVLPGKGRVVKVLRLATMFASMNLALAVGFWKWATGLQRGTWQRTTRTASGSA